MSLTAAPLLPSRPRQWLAVVAVTLVALLPFLGKPMHVDDPMYVWAAQQIRVHPLDPYGFLANWDGSLRPMPQVMQNPPLVCYYMAAASLLLGWGEVGLHLAFLPVAVLAALGTYLLAARFCRRPMVAALLLVASPAFLVSSTTLMCEGPLLCLWVWAVLLWVDGSTAATATRAAALTIAAGLLAAAAPLAKYPGVNLIPLLAAHAVVCPPSRRRTWAVQAFALLLPILALLAYDRATAARYGYGLVGDAVAFSRSTRDLNPASPPAKLLDALCYVGAGALPTAVVGLAVACRRPGWRPWGRRSAVLLAPVLLAGAAAAAYRAPSGWTRPNGPPAWAYFAQYGTLAALGVATVVPCAVGARDRRGLFLLLWVAGVFTFGTFLNWSINVRSFLPLLPATCILSARAVDRLDGPDRGPDRRMVTGALAVGGLVSLAVAVADYRYARDNRAAAAQLAAHWTAAGVAPSHVWFGGHWGFQYYMQLAGARPLDGRVGGYEAGDTVILALDNANTPAVSGDLVRAGSLVVGSGSWLTTMNLSMGGGFYVSEGDRLPFVVGPMPPEAYLITRLARLKPHR